MQQQMQLMQLQQQQQQHGVEGQNPFVKKGNTRYKTELCRAFQERGFCKYGEKCQVKISVRLGKQPGQS